MQMHKRISFFVSMMACLCLAPSTAPADEFESRINLELAFRDAILDKPAPSRLLPLIREGEVTITFVRDLPATIGKTDFFLKMDWSYDYQYQTQVENGVTNVSVTPSNIKPIPHLRHVIRMPVDFYRPEVWESRLLGHEFDHVAVSLDPRPRALLRHLCCHIPVYRFSLEGDAKPTDEQIRAGINGEIKRRQSAILDLIRANYATLDQVSLHGQSVMRDRKKYFDSLYTKLNLDAVEFAYQDEVEALLESEAYKSLRPCHVTEDPATRPAR